MSARTLPPARRTAERFIAQPRERREDMGSPVAVAVLTILAALSVHTLVTRSFHRMALDGVLGIQGQMIALLLYPVIVVLLLACVVRRRP